MGSGSIPACPGYVVKMMRDVPDVLRSWVVGEEALSESPKSVGVEGLGNEEDGGTWATFENCMGSMMGEPVVTASRA